MKRNQRLSLLLCLLTILSFMPLSVCAEALQPVTPDDTDLVPPTVSAEAAILMDADTKTILYEKNAHEQHYPASITKLMTALLAIENLEPTQQITFSKDAIYSIEPGSSHIGIKVDEVLTVDEALHGLLLMSANEVANGLGEAVSGSLDAFANRMTERAKELGAQNTHFVNANGLHDENHYTSAYDMALIGSYLAENDYFLKIMKDLTYEIPPTNITDETRYLYQQHYMLNPARNAKLYREDVIGGKTGYTDQARHTLVTMAKQGDTTLVAVMLHSDKPAIYTDTSALFDYGFASYESLKLHTSDEIVKTLPSYLVKSGQAYQNANYGLSLSDDVLVTVPHSVSKDDIHAVFDLPESLDASSKIGDVIGSVSFVLNGKNLAQSDLVIKQIDELTEPVELISSPQSDTTSTSPLETQNFISIWGKWILLGIVILIGLFLMIYFIKRRHLQKKYSKINKYFK